MGDSRPDKGRRRGIRHSHLRVTGTAIAPPLTCWAREARLGCVKREPLPTAAYRHCTCGTPDIGNRPGGGLPLICFLLVEGRRRLWLRTSLGTMGKQGLLHFGEQGRSKVPADAQIAVPGATGRAVPHGDWLAVCPKGSGVYWCHGPRSYRTQGQAPQILLVARGCSPEVLLHPCGLPERESAPCCP